MSKQIYSLHWGDEGEMGRIIYDNSGTNITLSYEPLTDTKFSYPSGLYPTSIVNRKLVTDKQFIPSHNNIIKWLQSRIYTADSQLIHSTLHSLGLREFDVWKIVTELGGKSADDKWWLVPDNCMHVPKYTHPALYLKSTKPARLSKPQQQLASKRLTGVVLGVKVAKSQSVVDSAVKVTIGDKLVFPLRANGKLPSIASKNNLSKIIKASKATRAVGGKLISKNVGKGSTKNVRLF